MPTLRYICVAKKARTDMPRIIFGMVQTRIGRVFQLDLLCLQAEVRPVHVETLEDGRRTSNAV
jgi:hypothetical protein